jgi:hypothetical protein
MILCVILFGCYVAEQCPVDAATTRIPDLNLYVSDVFGHYWDSSELDIGADVTINSEKVIFEVSDEEGRRWRITYNVGAIL